MGVRDFIEKTIFHRTHAVYTRHHTLTRHVLFADIYFICGEQLPEVSDDPDLSSRAHVRTRAFQSVYAGHVTPLSPNWLKL
jgi:hypothetical protein